MDSLLLFLEHSDPMVVQETLLTFVHLTQTLDDRKTLRGYPVWHFFILPISFACSGKSNSVKFYTFSKSEPEQRTTDYLMP